MLRVSCTRKLQSTHSRMHAAGHMQNYLPSHSPVMFLVGNQNQGLHVNTCALRKSASTWMEMINVQALGSSEYNSEYDMYTVCDINVLCNQKLNAQRESAPFASRRATRRVPFTRTSYHHNHCVTLKAANDSCAYDIPMFGCMRPWSVCYSDCHSTRFFTVILTWHKSALRCRLFAERRQATSEAHHFAL